ncbi:unnamed protein product, partial [marine sediment metagenome]
MADKKPKTKPFSSLLGRLAKRIYQPSIDKIVNQKVEEAINKVGPKDVVVNASALTSRSPDGTIRKSILSSGVGFATLREFSIFYPIARACIEYRKSQITQLDWNVAPLKVTKETSEDPKNIREIKEVKDFFKHPTGKSESTFTKFIKQILEDLLVIDAVAIYKLRNRRKDIIGYLPIDGSTIELILNLDGTLPDPPEN